MALLERDTVTGASHVVFDPNAEIARTKSVSDLIMVDIDEAGVPIGVEVAMDYRRLNDEHWRLVINAFPVLKETFPNFATFADQFGLSV
jgi:hypothetical protein